MTLNFPDINRMSPDELHVMSDEATYLSSYLWKLGMLNRAVENHAPANSIQGLQQMLDEAYEVLPEWIKQGIKGDNNG
jgi:hypothetical protein